MYLSFFSNRKDGGLPSKNIYIFFDTINRNCKKESQTEVIIFRNGASNNFLSIV